MIIKSQSFEEIVAWQKVQDLAVDVYQIFAANKDFGFLNQIRGAVVSIFNNIAGGYGRAGDEQIKPFQSLTVLPADCQLPSDNYKNFDETIANERKQISNLPPKKTYI